MATTNGGHLPVTAILSGHLRGYEIPNIPPKVVRVFLASTGQDTVTERNTLVREVYPQLRQYCRQKYGLEFQIVDLDWGLPTDSLHADQSLTDFKLREIRRCQRYTAGPTFVAIIGQRYGNKVLQTSIPAEEYDLIRMVLHKHKGRETRAAPILDKWYIKDNNSIAPVFVLQDVASVIPDIISNDKEKQNKADQEWKEAETEMKRLLNKGAEFCYLEGLIDSDTKQKYTMSEFENQTQIGIEESSCPSSLGVVLLRRIVDLTNYIDDPKAPIFTEILYNDKTEEYETDTVSSHLLSKMANRLRNLVSENNTTSFDVLWRYDDVISPELHKDYLKSFCDNFKNKLITLIDNEASKVPVDVEPEICEEALSHLMRCRDLADDFCVRAEELVALQSYLQNNYNHPIVIHGASGSGKSTLISKLCVEIPEVFNKNAITIVRYVGYTSRSSDIKQLLSSLCTQILVALGKENNEIPKDFKDQQNLFHNLLKHIPDDKLLIILLDGIEQISKDYNAHLLSWLPGQLPTNVKIILTTDPVSNKILEKLKKDVVTNESSFIELRDLDVESCVLTLDFFLFRYGRKLTDQQKMAFQSAFSKHPCLLYISLCAEKARYLKSTETMENVIFPENTVDAINRLFDELETEHGTTLVSRAMCYLVASMTGLGDLEMEDVLSMDDDVLNSIYVTHHPPTRRIPYIKWLRLKEVINRFLLERVTNGVTFYYWRHDQFADVIRERYMKDESIGKTVHSLLADYFLGTWANKPKPISPISNECSAVIKASGTSGERFVPEQPLTFQLDNSPVRFNRRMYDQVPRNLYKAERFDELNKLILFNYEWIYSKTKALSLQHIFADFALNPGVEAHLVEEALRVAEATIETDINNMAPEISGHLLPYYKTLPNIKALVYQCDTAGLKHCAMVPNFSYLQVPGSSLQFTFSTEVPSDYFRFMKDERFLLSKHRDSPYINVFDMITGETKKNIFTSNGALYVTPDGAKFLIVDHVTEKAIKVHKSETGEFIGQLIVLNNIDVKPKEKYKIADICLTNDRLCVLVTTDVSYLCIADIESCQFLQIICLDGRSDMCRISNDGQFVFCNSNEFLLSYDMYSLEHIYTLAIAYRPVSMAFTKDGCRAYLCNESETKLTIIHLHRGSVEMVYKTVLDEDMPNDRLQNLCISPNDEMVLVRGLENIVVYGRSNEKVIARFPRPKDVPKEFKLPKRNIVELSYKQAEFSRDGKFVIGTIFRNIYLWQISTGNLITTIQAPVGIIARLMVCQKSSHVVTQLDHSNEIQVWNIGDAVNQVDMLDKLSGPIVDVQVTSDNSIAYVVCKNSDEIGVIDMCSGVMLDLLTHDSNVKDFAITPSGSYALVSTSTKKKDISNKLWDMSERQIIKEFGNAVGFCISPHQESYILFVSQENMKYQAPYSVTMFRFIGDAFHEYVHPLALKFVLDKPFLTYDDKYLVVLTAQDHIQTKAAYDTPTICTFSMEEDMKVAYFTPESFEGSVNIGSILKLMPCKNNPYTIAVLYESSDDINKNYYANESGMGRGFLILDICSGSLISICYPFMPNEPRVDRGILFADDFSFCLDDLSNIFDIGQQDYIGRLTDIGVMPCLTALNGDVIVYCDNTKLLVVRVRDGNTIAACDVHSRLCKLKLCPNERTLIAGCEDGTIASYVIIDPEADDPESIVQHLGSRQVENSGEMDGRMSRSWDKVSSEANLSRPPSAMSNGPKERILLNKVEHMPVVRPSSDTLLYLNANSKTCSVM
ncbi:NACHT and WD repeat domain-containing protein 2-like [Mytilus trossulus]|uniref:NACHT and WD repeat domain-containing protein 2-like n=1 Tax=Mytilus trossulus TaxID=6551 RepID=UPI003005DA6B